MSSVLEYTLPENWIEERLENLISLGSTITYGVVQPGPEDEQGVPFVRGGDIYNGKIAVDKLRTISQNVSKEYKRTLLEGGELLMSLVGYPGEVAIVPSELKGANIARQAAYIKLDEKIDNKYLMYYLLSEIGKFFLFQKSTGSAQQVINLVELKEVNVILPPLAQQQKIAKIISTVDDLIEKTQTLIDKYTAIKQGMMADLFTRGIDMTTGDTPNSKAGKLRPSVEDAPELYKETELGWVPKEWEVTTLENEHQIHSGSTPSRQEVERYFKNGNIQWIKTLDLNEAEIRTTEEQITKLALKESSCRLLPVNTVLIAMYGGWIQIGRTAILKAECATNQAICALIPNPEKLIPEFSMYYLQHFKEVWKKVAISTRKDPNITKSDVNRFPYLIPSLGEQNEIVLIINSINDVLKNQISLREKFKKQKKGLMQDLLTGKVRVN
jgi:type I restriction enzyme S subunit